MKGRVKPRSLPSLTKALDRSHGKTVRMALQAVERQARSILQGEPELLREFVMGMGRMFFVLSDGSTADPAEFFGKYRPVLTSRLKKSSLSRLAKLRDFEQGWGETLRLTGYPMRFTAKGPTVRDW